MSVDKIFSQPTLYNLEPSKVFGERVKMKSNNEEIGSELTATKGEVE